MHRVPAIWSLVSFFVASGLQISDWHNPYVASGLFVIAATLFLYAVRDRIRLTKQLSQLLPRNRINWNFSGFLGGGIYPPHGIRIGGFQASAINKTGRTLTDVHGYIESLNTGEKFDLFLNVDGLPVRPEETHGIPNGARFNVYVPFIVGERHANSWEQLTLIDFLSKLGEFTFVFCYDGRKHVRKFSKKETEEATAIWRNALIGRAEARVVRRERQP